MKKIIFITFLFLISTAIFSFRDTGFLDTKLTEKGENQAKVCYELLKHVKFEKVICSDLQRAHKTACIVSDLSEEELLVKEGLREMNFGRWEGLSHKEIL